ncbi:MAG: hypothetical protein K9I36_11105 [Bacteroidia bacterium]|nr:hypothetical protein [Bacteroidia bacterium]MCF8427271.1 hypothetical protein [Bacteroidia bacterium]
MKAKLAILLLTFGLHPSFATSQPLQKLWHSLTDKKGNWGKIPNTGAKYLGSYGFGLIS